MHERDGDLRGEATGELFKQLSSDLSTLIRQELALAQAEMTQKGKRAAVGAGFLGSAGVVGLLLLGSFTACIVAALSEEMHTWLAALIVTVLYGAIAAVLALTGKNRVTEAVPPVPEKTVESVKEDVQWAKTQLPSSRR